MTNLFRICCALLGFAAAASVLACPAKATPSASRWDTYDEVFLGEVVGVRLSGYLEARKQRGGDFSVDSTPAYDLEVRVIERLRGQPTSIVRLRAGGCGVREPSPREQGLFAVIEGGLVAPVYESESSFKTFLEAFRKRAKTSSQ